MSTSSPTKSLASIPDWIRDWASSWSRVDVQAREEEGARRRPDALGRHGLDSLTDCAELSQAARAQASS